MRNQTHQPFSFLFPSFISIPSPSTTTSPLLSPSLQEMKCVEEALKTSYRKKMAFKPTPEAFVHDIWAVNWQNGVSSEDFLVEEFLDLSNEEGFLGEEPEEEDEEKAPTCSPSACPQKKDPEDHSSNESTSFDYESLPASELSVPADGVADLEWLSHFVEDSNSEYSGAFPAGTIPVKPKTNTDSPPQPENPVASLKTPVPAKARSKRTRNGGRVWSRFLCQQIALAIVGESLAKGTEHCACNGRYNSL